MTSEQYTAIVQFRDAFRSQTEKWSREFSAALLPLQQSMASTSYKVETPIVYNTALDSITKDSDIRLIITGDNPGKTEQMAEHRKYMVGMSGHLAASFFAKHPELGIDWNKNVIILNKTPVHTARTEGLRLLDKDERASKLLHESQEWMARHTALLHQRLNSNAGTAVATDTGGMEGTDGAAGTAERGGEVALWVVGYGQMRRGGVFEAYRDALLSCYSYPAKGAQFAFPYSPFTVPYPLLFQHFSMNRFAIDFKRWQDGHNGMSTAEALFALGKEHAAKVFNKEL